LATVTQTALWIPLPELPIEYFDSEVLLKIGKTFVLVNLFKLIPVTELATRGRFAKICDLSAPPGLELASIVKRLKKKEYIPYENAMGNT